MSVNILTYMLAASLIQGGMNWKQVWERCFSEYYRSDSDAVELASGRALRNSIPVLARASFGVLAQMLPRFCVLWSRAAGWHPDMDRG